METAITIVLSIFGGGALLTFLQFMISRHDEKKGKHKAIMDAIEVVRKDTNTLRDEFEANRAENARVRVLRFSDEIRIGVRHSLESFDQVHDDIDQYNLYCKAHPEYRNNKAVNAIANINRIYAKCLEENDFLE